MSSPEGMSQNTGGEQNGLGPSIISITTPSAFSERYEEIRGGMGFNRASMEHSTMEISNLEAEVPQYILEVNGGLEEAIRVLEKSKNPRNVLILIDHNIPEDAQITTKRSENLRVLNRGAYSPVFIYSDSTHDNLPVAIALTEKFKDDLEDYVGNKKGGEAA